MVVLRSPILNRILSYARFGPVGPETFSFVDLSALGLSHTCSTWRCWNHTVLCSVTHW